MEASPLPPPPAPPDAAPLAPLLSAPDGFPVSTRQFSAVIAGVRTDFVLSAFSDRILVIATQLGKLGTMVAAAREQGEDDDGEAYKVGSSFILNTPLHLSTDGGLLKC